MKAHNGADVQLLSGKRGEFSVVNAAGDKLWDKFETGRFPEHAEVLSQLS
ncbi:MAG TPA: hypothetical protein ENK23_01070 [Sorangium sp.]|nr:hypothetical protein [Sorangium sp.]